MPSFRLIVKKVAIDFEDRLLPPKPVVWISPEDLPAIKSIINPSTALEGSIVNIRAQKVRFFGRLLVDRSLNPGTCKISSIASVSLFHKLDVHDEALEIGSQIATRLKPAKFARLALAPFSYPSLDICRSKSHTFPLIDSNFTAKYILASTIVIEGGFVVINWFNRLDLIAVVKAEGDVFEASPSNETSSSSFDSDSLLVIEETTKLEFVDWMDAFLPVVTSSEIQPILQSYPSSSQLKNLLKSCVGGVDRIIDDLVDISHGAIFDGYSMMPRGFLFTGSSGTGKTYLAKQFAELSGLNAIMVNAPEIFEKGEGETETALAALFARAQARPSVIVIDELESIASNRKLMEGAIERRLLARFLTLLDDFAKSSPQSICIGICSSVSVLDPAVCRAKRLEKVFQFRIPTPDARLAILKIETRKFPPMDPTVLERLSHRTPGFTGADLAHLCRHTLMAHIKAHSQSIDSSALPTVEFEIFEASLSLVKASALSAYVATPPVASFDELRGMEDIIKELKASVLAPFAEEERFKEIGAQPPAGVLLYGPPGVGKSKLAMALANASKINFIAVNTTEIVSKVVGESERNLAQVFQNARAASPCILFLDQIDSIARMRGNDNTEEQSGDRILSLLLTEMDGIQKQTHGSQSEEFSQGPLIVLAATNKPHMLDPAILRPGRFDHVLYIPPTTPDTRLAIIEYFSTRTPCPDVDQTQWKTLAQKTKGFTGADLESLFREASYLALKKNIHTDRVSWQDILEVLPTIPASLMTAEITHPYNRNLGFAFIN